MHLCIIHIPNFVRLIYKNIHKKNEKKKDFNMKLYDRLVTANGPFISNLKQRVHTWHCCTCTCTSAMSKT